MSILRSKIQAPAVPTHVIARPRLADRIAQGEERLVVLQAPAGYGKSVLAAQVRARAPRSTAWLHLDPDDSDPRRLSRYIAASLAEVLPGIARTELLTAADSSAFDIARWTDDLILYLDEVADRRYLLVLDNFESALEGNAPHDWLSRILNASPAHLRLLIATRRPLPMKLRRLIEQGHVAVFQQDQLALDLDEYREAVAARGVEANDQEIERRWGDSQGWCVMLGLGGEARAGEAYLEEEVLPGLPTALRDFMAMSSPFDVITAAAAQAAGVPESEFLPLLQQMSVHGIPHLLLQDGNAARVHPVLRERLVMDLLKREDGQTRARDAASHYRSTGQYEQARRVLMEAGCPDEVLVMLDEDWSQIDRAGLHARAQEWIEPLRDTHARHPLYAATLTRLLRLSGQHEQLLEYLQGLRASGEPIEQWDVYPLLWSGDVWVRTHLSAGGDYEACAREWQALRERARKADAVLAEHSLAAQAVYALRFEAARQHVERVLKMVPDEESTQWANARNILGVALQESGRWKEAVALFRETIDRCKGQGDTLHLEINCMGLAWSLKELGRFDEALEALDQAIAVGARMGGTRALLLPHVLRTRGEILWHTGQRREGMVQLEQAYALFGKVNRLEALGTGVIIDHLKTCAGERSALVTASDFKDPGAGEPRVRFLVRSARQALASKRTSEAGALLDDAQALAQDMLGWQATVGLHRAMLRSHEGDRKGHRSALAEALANLETIDTGHYPMADPWLTTWAIVEATAAGLMPGRAAALVHGGLVAELGDAFRARLQDRATTRSEATRLMEAALRWRVRGLDDVVQAAKTVPADLRTAYVDMLDHAPLPALRVRMFGPLSISAAGRDTQFTRKASRGVVEMLLLEYPHPVHEERLLDALWPEADPKSARGSLRTAVNDLRRSLDPFQSPNGPSYMRFRDEHYVLELPDGSDVDYHVFRDTIPELSRRVLAGGTPADRDSLARVLDMWRGELLSDAPYADHVIELRERARSEFLDGTASIARAILKTNSSEATRYLERGLEADPYWAEGLAILMECLRLQDRVLAALRRYRQYEERLARDIGAEPDPILRELFDRLTHG